MKNLRILLVLLLFCSCNQNISEGTIIEKWFEPYREYGVHEPRQVGRMMLSVSYHVYDYEDYCIKVSHEIFNKKIMRCYYATKQQYDTLKIGDNVSVKEFYIEDFNNKEK